MYFSIHKHLTNLFHTEIFFSLMAPLYRSGEPPHPQTIKVSCPQISVANSEYWYSCFCQGDVLQNLHNTAFCCTDDLHFRIGPFLFCIRVLIQETLKPMGNCNKRALYIFEMSIGRKQCDLITPSL